MIIKEYRIILPLTVKEYHTGQLWSMAEASKFETGGGEGVEIVKNEPFTDVPLFDGKYNSGQYTFKIYHLQSKVSPTVQKLVPKGAMHIQEEAWNAYPYAKTVLTNPDYMKDNFYAKIETIHLPDRGTTENAHNLSSDQLAKREVITIDIADDTKYLKPTDVKPETSPSQFVSTKTGRGKLKSGWQETHEPVMCAYKLVTVYFKWFGLQSIMENYAQNQYPRLFTIFHREVFCWIDQWIELSIEEVREFEEKTKKELDEARKSGCVRGLVADK